MQDSNLDHNSGRDIMTRNTKNILDFFLVDRDTIESEMRTILEENDLNRNNFDKIFDTLESPPNHFTAEEIVINDISMLSSVVRFDGSAFVFVTCR